MGSPLSPVIANFIMEDFEKKAVEQVTHKPVCWYRYVDDTFVIWPHGQEKLTEFLKHLSRLHNNIVYNGKRGKRSPCIPGRGHLQKNGWLPRPQNISGTHPYKSLPTPEFASPSC